MCITTYTNRVCKDFISQHENIGNSNRQLFVQLQCSTTVLTVAAAAVLFELQTMENVLLLKALALIVEINMCLLFFCFFLIQKWKSLANLRYCLIFIFF